MNVIDLRRPEARARARSGGKAAELAARIADGMPVPEGFVVTTTAFSQFLDSLGVAPETPGLQRRVCEARFPEGLAEEIGQCVDRLDTTGPSTRWAVRSSAIAEDGEDASFAGQYETILGVCSRDLPEAVQRIWGSSFSERAARYRAECGVTDLGMAVLVQRQLSPDTAGVCFTADPTEEDQGLVINANYGLGESVVGGHATPDTYRIDRERLVATKHSVGAKRIQMIVDEHGVETVEVSSALRERLCLSPAQVTEIARLALAVETHHGKPVDIEWAYQEGVLFLLQARPIIVAARRDAAPPPDWHPANDTPIDPRFPLYSNGNISEVLPGCVTPLSWDHTGRLIEHAFRAQLQSLGAMDSALSDQRILGFFFHRPYINVSLLLHAADRTPGMTPDTILEEFVRKPERQTPSWRMSDLWPHRWPRLISMVRAVVWHSRTLDDRIESCRGTAELDAIMFSESAVATASDEALVERVRMGDELAEPSVVHVWASTLASVAFTQLRRRTASWLKDDRGALASELVTGIAALPSAQPALALHALSERIATDGTLARMFEEGHRDEEILAALRDRPPGTELERFLADHGHRGVAEAELSRPCWREDPVQIVALIRNNLRPGAVTPVDVHRRQQRAHRVAMRRLEPLPWWKRAWLSLLVRRARSGFLNRETMKDLVIRRLDRSRIIYRELNRRLVARKLLETEDDLFFLTSGEVRDLFRGVLSEETAASIVEARRRDYTWSRRVEVPKLQEGTARTLRIDDSTVGDALEGMGVSPGQVVGLARVVTDPRTSAHFEPGEILVAPVTDVAWTPLFAQAAGLVVEVGGLLSHGSIVAREYGIPAVVGVADATRLIQTGDRIAIDGAQGQVRRLEPKGSRVRRVE